MSVSLAERVAVIDLTDEDDVMHVSDDQVIEEIHTSPCCSLTLSAISKSNKLK